MKTFHWAIWLVLAFCSIQANAQTAESTNYKPSNFEALQESCNENGIILDYERFGFVLHSSCSKGDMFFLPLKKKFIWKVWRNVADKDIFLVKSAIWNTKTGRLKNEKTAKVLINVQDGTVYDKKNHKKYFLFDDYKEYREKISTMFNSKKLDNF